MRKTLAVLIVGTFLVLFGQAGPAVAAPAARGFGPAIDAYAAAENPSTCSPAAKPGAVAFQQLVLKQYPNTRSGGIGQACGEGSISPDDHEEGRAFDWMVSASTQLSTANDLLNWLLATDRYGNPHALARRFGIKYIIWNHKIWESYRAGLGWQNYTGTGNPHTDHVHFSFSWDGAYQRTSWWGRPRTDRDGDRHGDLVLSTGTQLWSFGGNQHADFWEVPLKHFDSAHMANTRLAMGDVNGDQRADAIVARAAGPTSTEFYVGTAGADGTFSGWDTAKAVFGLPLDTMKFAAGDLDNDGHDDLVILGRAADGTAELWSFGGNRHGDFWEVPLKHFFLSTAFAGAELNVTDVNGDYRADVVLARAATESRTEFHVLVGNADRTLGPTGEPKAVFGMPLAAMQIRMDDVNGDGYGDLVLLGRGANGNAELWSFGGNQHADFWEVPTQHFGNSLFMAGAVLTLTDVNGDRRADVVLGRDAGENRTEFHVMAGNADRTFGGWGTVKAVFGVERDTLQVG